MSRNQSPYASHSRFHLAVDSIIFGFEEGELKLLIHKRRFEPFKGHWSLFGGFLREGEGLDEGANRILFDLTGLKDIYMEEIQAYGEIDRDPAGRVVSVAYSALIPAHRYSEKHSSQYGATWVSLDDLPELIMDHNAMVHKALRRLRRRAATQPIGFELLPKEFTMPQLQLLYEAIYQTELDKRNFRKKILSMGLLIKLEEKDMSGSKKGAYLYKFDKTKYEQLVDKGYSFAL
jgi:8-oxo-dGTP diphosphatase